MSARHTACVSTAIIVPSILLFAAGWSVLTADANGQTANPVAPDATRIAPDVVTLSADKVVAAGIKTERAQKHRLQPTRLTPGRLRYDERRHVEVKTAAAGIVRQILVKPGDRVEPGDLLAEITSAEVGQSRAELLRLNAERDLARRHLERSRAISEGLDKLVDQIEHQADPRQAADEVESIVLGEYRATILSVYAAFRLAEWMQRSGDASVASGALSGRQVEQRRLDYVAARAALQSAIDEAQFNAAVALQEAQNHLADAERRAAISAQFVAALQGAAAASTDFPSADLSHLQLLAPIAGTIEAQRFAASERVASGDSLFVVADTSQLWVQADIREQEWGALQLIPGQAVSVTGPTIEGRALSATVHYLGREVSSITNAASLIATIDNSAGKLRPGQFVQVRVPVARLREALAVPESAILAHEGLAFVFVQETPSTFRRVNVAIGVGADGSVEVLSGLQEGAAVVTSGAFQLKSELLIGQLAE
jgi:cobalt-zinc-cadmium efflux system membrane fusion protein